MVIAMDEHTATELAYKNGYANGVKEFADRLRKVAFRGFWETRDYVEVDQIDDIEYEMVGGDGNG
jgi:hypothetical protein